ncbi:MAG: bifunctional 2-acylglycerophosphoethanolamine acyltransferase/acyl-ACP synthetase [Gammaproteobacteria bacterium]|nr:MAG: bifunctional 2-acylglycerophosphoethanolamine acyltransferase/acyl-ACP synthetase [Gammaproteobacteria bacterium]
MKAIVLPKLVKWLIATLFRVEIDGDYQGGRQHGHERTLIIANHASFLDGVLLALFLPETPIFVVNTEIAKHWFFKFFLSYVEHLTVDPAHPMAMKHVVNLLEEGKTVAIFPEGRITNTGALMKVYAGAAFAALKAQATIIPVYISGGRLTYLSRVRELYRPRLFPKLKLTILPPTRLDVPRDQPSHQRRELAKEQMHHLMMEMMVAAHEPQSIYEQLLNARYAYGKKHHAYEDGLTDDLTYNDVVQKSIALSVILKKRGLSKRVGLMLPNSNPAILTFYALQYLNRIPAMLNYTAGFRAVCAGMTACEADTIITSRAFVDKANLHDLIAELGDYRLIYLEDLRDEVSRADKLQILVRRQFARWGLPAQSPDDEAVVLFTSGSEGLPKGVVHSHNSMLTNVAQIQAIYDITPSDKFMICLPMFHVFGLMAGALLPVASGSAAFLYPNPLHYRAIPEVIYDRDCTILLSTSTFLKGYARFADPYDFRRIRYIIAGAEKLSQDVVSTYLNQFGIRIMEGYGTTETAPVISANTSMMYQRHSVGCLLPGMRAELAPIAGIEAGGRLIVRGDNVMLGYLRPEAAGVIEPSPSKDGLREYDTGDIADLDARGFIHIHGRVKRFAKLAGEMISLDSVEKLAATASAEHHHAVVNNRDDSKGEGLVLFTTDAELNRKHLQTQAKNIGLPELAVPRDIRVIKEIPVFSSGKTNYPALSGLFDE